MLAQTSINKVVAMQQYDKMQQIGLHQNIASKKTVVEPCVIWSIVAVDLFVVWSIASSL